MANIRINNLEFEEYVSIQEINQCVKKVADRINKDYAGREPLFVCVLNGAFMFASDLFKRIKLPAEITFVRLKSYEGTNSTGEVQLLSPLVAEITGRNIIILEDIVDTGLTMHGFIQYLYDEGANSVEVASFLFKPESLRFADAEPKYVGIKIPTKFVLGYGLDYNELGRNLPALYVLKQ